MECRHGNFWIGLGIGSILGAVVYRLSRTAKAKQLEVKFMTLSTALVVMLRWQQLVQRKKQ